MNSNDYIAFDSSNAMIRELKRKWREYEEKVRKRSTVNILYFHIHRKEEAWIRQMAQYFQIFISGEKADKQNVENIG